MDETVRIRWYRRVRIEEWLALGVFFAVMPLNIFLYHSFSTVSTLVAVVRYFSFGDPLYVLFVVCLYAYFLFFVYRELVEETLSKIIDRKPFSAGMAKRFLLTMMEPLRIMLPIGLVTIALYCLLGNLDTTIQWRANDLVFYYADSHLFGALPSFFLPTVFHNAQFVNLIAFAYESLFAFWGVSLLIFFLVSRGYLFRLTIISFMLSIIFAFPFYYSLPCQDPSNAFIYNIRQLTYAPDIASAIVGYSPSSLTSDITQNIHASEYSAKSNAVPVSCFPSMHAAWSIILVYFLACWRKKTLFLTVPWVALILTGGVYFAQHYVIDYLMAGVIATLAIIAARTLFARFGRNQASLTVIAQARRVQNETQTVRDAHAGFAQKS